jgi:hypothetical protein
MKGMKKQTHKVTDNRVNRPSNGRETNTPFPNYTQSNHQIHPKQTFKVMARKHARKTNIRRHEKQTP